MKIGIFTQNRDFWGAKLIHAPLFHAVRGRWPGAEVTALCPYAGHSFFIENALADRSLRYDKGVSGLRTALKELGFDVIICLRPESVWLNLALALTPAKEKLGFRHFFSALSYTSSKPYTKTIYRAAEFKGLVNEGAGLADYFMRFPPRRLPGSPKVFILPGGGAGEFKRWGIENFLAVCRALDAPGVRFYFVLGEQEEPYLRAVNDFCSACGGEVLYRLPLPELASCFHSADLFISNDCGPLHIAQMLAKPVVMILSDERHCAQRIAAEWYLPRPDCRLVTGGPGQDIKLIKPETVLKAAAELLALAK